MSFTALRTPSASANAAPAEFPHLQLRRVRPHVKGGRVTKIEGNPKHPLSRGRLCPRGTGGAGLLYDPDRLKRPLVRRDARGMQAFEEVSWDDALDEVAAGMLRLRDKYGPESLALYTHGYGGSWFRHLIRAYGSPEQRRSLLRAVPRATRGRLPAHVRIAGVGSPESTDMPNARVITLIGSHLGENMHNTQVQDFATALSTTAPSSLSSIRATQWRPARRVTGCRSSRARTSRCCSPGCT